MTGRMHTSFTLRTLRVFLRHKPAVIGLAVLLLMATGALLAPVLSPHAYFEQDFAAVLLAPTPDHWLGTDNFGRDVLSRLIWGARTSLGIAFVGAGIAIGVGVVVGAVAGFWGGRYDYLLMRATDTLMSIPTIFLALLVIAIFGQGTATVIWILGLAYWPNTARIVRAQTLAVKNRDFVLAAESYGSSPLRILLPHVFPNISAFIIVQGTVFIAQAVLIETTLSFLGVGAQPPLPSWGNMLSVGRQFIQQAWWLATFPGLAIFVTVFGLNMLGDGLRDALDPKSLLRA